MRRRAGVVAALAIVTSEVACGGASLFEPVPADEVTITVQISGGFAGVGHTVVVDGAEGAARISCTHPCGGLATRIALSDAQISRLAAGLEAAGVVGLHGTDFGVDCCDIFQLALTYRRGSRTVRVEGTTNRWPADLLEATWAVAALRDGVVQTLVSPDTRPGDWPRDAYTLGSVRLAASTLRIGATYGGGCADHRMDLVAWGGWQESFPVQIEALLTHDAGGDTCEGLLTTERAFDLRPLRAAYVEAYGEIPEAGATVVLRLADPRGGEPVLVEVGL